jgi:hypothetical protein
VKPELIWEFKVMLALVPVRAPRSKMARGALMELHLAHEMFERAVPFGGRAVKMLVCLTFIINPHH